MVTVITKHNLSYDIYIQCKIKIGMLPKIEHNNFIQNISQTTLKNRRLLSVLSKNRPTAYKY